MELEGPKGVSKDVTLNKDIVTEKEVTTPSYEVNDDVVKHNNEVSKHPKQTSPKPILRLCPSLKECLKLNLTYNLESF